MNFERTSRCDCELLTLTKYVYHQFYERVVFLSEWDFCTIHFLWWAVHVSIIWKIINGPPGPSAIYQLTEYHRSLDLVHLTRLGIKDSSGLSSTEGWSRAAYMMTSISGAIYNINSSSNPLTMRIIYIYIYPLSLSLFLSFLSILSLYPFSLHSPYIYPFFFYHLYPLFLSHPLFPSHLEMGGNPSYWKPIYSSAEITNFMFTFSLVSTFFYTVMFSHSYSLHLYFFLIVVIVWSCLNCQ